MLNTPNMLSIFRLCLAPVFVVIYFSGMEDSTLLAALVYALATFTDCLDGRIARKYNLVTNLGKVLDPLGDKMLTFAVLACITIDKIIPFWVLLVFMGKELCMGLGGLLIHRVAKAEIPASNIIGKTATVLFFIVCIVLMVFDHIPHAAAVTMICVCLAISMAAFASYYANYRRIMMERRKTR
jgi:cardiolipin synthase